MSNEEKFFGDWLTELESYGLASDISYQPKTYLLQEAISIPVKVKLKTKTKIRNQVLYRKIEYTPDYSFKLSLDLENKLFNGEFFDSPLFIKLPDQDFIVDTKGTFKANNSDITAPIKIKWVWQLYKEYVQLVQPFGGLFKDTFYPESYFTLDSGKPRCKRVKGKMVPISELGFKKIKDWYETI